MNFVVCACLQPTWWDAVRYVPPLGTLARIKKKNIPRLTFIEDRLIRCVCVCVLAFRLWRCLRVCLCVCVHVCL